MKCWNCNTEMEQFPNMHGMIMTASSIASGDIIDEGGNEGMIYYYDTFRNMEEYEEEHTTLLGRKKKFVERKISHIRPVYNVCPNCGLIAQSVAQDDMEKLF